MYVCMYFYLFYRKGSLKGYQISYVISCCIFNTKIISMNMNGTNVLLQLRIIKKVSLRQHLSRQHLSL